MKTENSNVKNTPDNNQDPFEGDQFKTKTSKSKGLNIDKDGKLPIVFHESEIMENIQNNVVTLVCGETGSGKSTQLP